MTQYVVFTVMVQKCEKALGKRGKKMYREEKANPHTNRFK
jgi:hypothetical protein